MVDLYMYTVPYILMTALQIGHSLRHTGASHPHKPRAERLFEAMPVTQPKSRLFASSKLVEAGALLGCGLLGLS